MSTTAPSAILHVNPYDAHPALSPVEAEVLWEYAKLAHNVKQLSGKARLLGDEPDKTMLARLRTLEKKMALVLTLFKASVWGVINEQSAAEPAYVYNNDSNDTIRL